MALPNVRVLIQNGLLGGLVQLDESVTGLVCTGTSVTDGIQLGAPVVIFSYAQLLALGVTEVNNPAAERNVREFYTEAGEGAELYLMLVPNTVDQADMLDGSNASGAAKLLDFAQGRIRVLATAFAPGAGYTLDDADGVDADVYAALTNGQALAEAYALQNLPFRFIVEGRAYNGTPADLSDIRARTNNRGAAFIGGSQSGTSSGMGMLLGRIAQLPAQRSIARVKDGSLAIVNAFLGTAVVEEAVGISLIHDKGWITLRTIPTRTGYFFSDDPMAVATTDDYNSLGRGRVIDKAHIIAYATYVDELNNDVGVDANGQLTAGYIKYLEGLIQTQLNALVVASGNASALRVSIDPAQDIITNNKLVVVLRLTPVGYTKEIEVQLGFENPANQ